MATFAEICYSCLDLLKLSSDDAYFTEEHVLFLMSKVRALLLERKYRRSRNASFSIMSEENKQQVCLRVQPASNLPGGCITGNWLQSTEKIPALMPEFPAVACTAFDLLDTNVAFIPEERMRYVGYNKWLHNIIYASKSRNGYLYLKGFNPQFQYLQMVGLTGIFSDPIEAAKLSHEACLNGGICDILEQPFPLEEALVPSCIELVVQELLGSKYMPEDKDNNAKDDLPETASNVRKSSPVENTTYKPREEQEA